MLRLKLRQNLEERSIHFLLRTQEKIEATDGVYLSLNGMKYLSFATNNYLGLAHHPQVMKACHSALKKYGVGSGSAYLVSGYTSLHAELEEKLAEFLNYPRVLLLSSGYLANTGIISALFSKNDEIFADKLIHASLIDGCLASKAIFRRYPHSHMDTLESYCKNSTAKNKVIISEGLFGMDGTIAPLDKIQNIAQQNNAMVLIDDAHGVGVLGKNGRGSIEHFNLGIKEVPILVGTLGKAFGSYGAFVASDALIIDTLTQLTRTYLYTTAIPAAMAAASIASLQLIKEESWRRDNLQELINHFRQGLKQFSIPCLESQTPIQPILMPSNQKALELSQKLRLKGIFVKAIRPPTVPSPRLRITITAEHTKAQLDRLLEGLVNEIKVS